MIKSLKLLFEKIAYAGLKPQGGTPVANAPGPAGKSAPELDPLYLSNRTLAQKLKDASKIGVPVAVLLGLLTAVLLGAFDKEKPLAPPPEGLSSAELAQKMLPSLAADVQVEGQHDLDVQDLRVVPGSPSRVSGIAKNNTNHAIAKVEIVFDLADKVGSRQGAVSTQLTNIASRSSVPFQFNIVQGQAAFAIVRDVHLQ